MNLFHETISDIAEAIAGIDIDATNSALADNDRLTDKLQAGIEDGTAQVRALERAAENARRAGPDFDAAASALLRGEDVMDVLATPADVDARLLATRQALQGLRRQLEGARQRRREIRSELVDALSPVGDLACPPLIAEARNIIARLAQLYADAAAVAAATSSGTAARLVERIADPLARLAERSAPNEMWRDEAPLRPSPGLAAALDGEAMAIARRSVPDEIAFPVRRLGMDATSLAHFAAARARGEAAAA